MIIQLMTIASTDDVLIDTLTSSQKQTIRKKSCFNQGDMINFKALS